MRLALLALAGCAPLDDAGVRLVGIDLVPVLAEELPEGLVDLDRDAIAASTGRIETQPFYGDGFLEGKGLPVPPDGWLFYGVLGFAHEPREELVHGHDEEETHDAEDTVVVGPLQREEDGHTSLTFFASDTAPHDLGALRTAQIVVSSSAEPTDETAATALEGEFEFTETGAVATGHSHGP